MRVLKEFGLVLTGATCIIVLLASTVMLGGTWSESTAEGKLVLAGLAMLGLAGLVASVRTNMRLRQADADDEMVEAIAQSAAFRGDHLEASLRTASILIMVVATIFFALMAVGLAAMIAAGRATVMVVLIGVPVFGLALLAASQSLWNAFFAGRPWLRMDTKVFDSLPYGPIPWVDVIAMQGSTETRSQRPFLRLLVRKPGQYLRRSWFERLLSGKRLHAEIGELRVPIGLFDQHHATISSAAQQLRERVQPPLLKVWLPGMGLQQVEQQLRNEEILRRLNQISEGDPARIDAAEIAETESLVAELSGSDPLRSVLEANARRARRALALFLLVAGIAIALQAYRFLRL